MSETTQWIVSDCFLPRKFPPTWIRLSTKIHNQPLIVVYEKKKYADTEFPEFVVILKMLNYEFLYVLPFVDNNDVVLSESAICKMKEIFGLSKYIKADFSSEKKIPLCIPFDIELEKGTTIKTVNKSELDSVFEEIRRDTSSNISGFFIKLND